MNCHPALRISVACTWTLDYVPPGAEKSVSQSVQPSQKKDRSEVLGAFARCAVAAPSLLDLAERRLRRGALGFAPRDLAHVVWAAGKTLPADARPEGPRGV